MNFAKLFSSPKRVRILKNIIFLEGPVIVNDVAKKLKLSKSFVSNYLRNLKKQGILESIKGKRGYRVNQNGYVRAIRILLNLTSISPRFFKRYDYIEAVGVYGSCAKGDNTQESDFDIWIKLKHEVPEEQLASLSQEIKKKIQNAKIIFLTPDKMKLLKEKDGLFYYSLYFGSIIIYGDQDALHNLMNV